MRRFVRVYIEGGAEGRRAINDFRRAWKRFLNTPHEQARARGFVRLEVIRGQGRAQTFDLFRNHRRRFPDDLCFLLVDSETAVPAGKSVWQVVSERDGDKWIRPAWATDDHLFLMVHMVETWLLTDQDALARYFKSRFSATSLPRNNLEQRSKADIEDALAKASSGAYRHGLAHEIIELMNPNAVRCLAHGERLFSLLEEKIRIG